MTEKKGPLHEEQALTRERRYKNSCGDMLRAKLTAYFASALISPDLFGLPQPVAKS